MLPESILVETGFHYVVDFFESKRFVSRDLPEA